MKDVLFLISKQVLHDNILKETKILAKHHRDVVPRKSEGLKNYSKMMTQEAFHLPVNIT